MVIKNHYHYHYHYDPYIIDALSPATDCRVQKFALK